MPKNGVISKILGNKILLIFFICLIIYNSNFRSINSGDTIPASLLPFNILKGHGIYFDQYAQEYKEISPQFNVDGTPYFFLEVNNHYLSLFPIVTPVIVTPLYIIPYIFIKIFNLTPSMHDPIFYGFILPVMEKLSASLIASLSVVFVYLSLRELFDEKVSLITSLIYAFGTSTWVISSQALWQHGMIELLLSMIIYFILVDIKNHKDTYIAYLGALSGLIAFCRPPDTILAIPAIIYLISTRNIKNIAIYAISGIVATMPFIFYNYLCFNNIAGGYITPSVTGHLELNLLDGLAMQILSPNRGMFVYSPILVLAVIGVYLIYINKNFCDKKKVIAMILAATAALSIFVYCTFYWGNGGWFYGYRYLVGSLPIYAICLGGFFNWFFHECPRSYRLPLTAVILVLLMISLFVQIVGVFYYPNGNWDGDPDLLQHIYRIWDYKDSQIMRTFYAGPVTSNFITTGINYYKTKDIISLEGAYGIEEWNVPTQWMSNNSYITYYSPENKSGTVSLKVMSFQKPATLIVSVDGDVVFQKKIGTDFEDVEINIDFKKGFNRITLSSQEGSIRPCDIPELKSQDTRSLSFAIQNINIK